MTENNVPPAVPQAAPPGAQGWPPAGEVSKDDRTTAMLALLFAGLTFLVPLIISALRSAELAEATGLPHDRIIVSAKVSTVRDLVDVYRALARRWEPVDETRR